MSHLFVSPVQNFIGILSFCLRDFHSFFQSDFTDLHFQQQVYRCQICDVDHLKEQLIEEWRRFDQNVIDRAVNQWRDQLRKCIHTKGGHFEHLM